MLDRLAALVTCESPSGSIPALRACAELIQPWLSAALRKPAEIVEIGGKPHLIGAAERPKVLILGHLDTVWPLGTLQELPFTVKVGIARGPGVFDMKAGIAQMLTAIEILDDPAHVSVLLTSDEEVGSVTSRDLIEDHARRAGAVLVCEPSADGAAVKIGCKGIANYKVEVVGHAAHAGLEPARGVNAGVELARIVLAIAAMGRGDTTVSPTVLAAGTTVNTIPEHATCAVDARSWSHSELEDVDEAMKKLRPALPGARVVVSGGIDRPPFEEHASEFLYNEAQKAAREVSVRVPAGERSGGGSDGNITAAIGVATLDGLGAVGGYPHGRDEFVEIGEMPTQAALLAGLLRRLGAVNSC